MGLFDKILARMTHSVTGFSFGARSVSYDRAAYEQETVRAIIDCIASHAAKADVMHVVVDKDERIRDIRRDSPYARLLNVRPNNLMTAYEMRYKLFSQLENYTTALACIRWDGVVPREIIPVNYRTAEFFKLDNGEYAVNFVDSTGTEYRAMLEDLVCLRKFYNSHDAMGDGNAALKRTLDMIEAGETSMQEAVGVSNKIRGFVKQKMTVHGSPALLKAAKEFDELYARAAKDGGFVPVGMDSDVTMLDSRNSTYALTAAQMQDIRDGLYRYFRVSEKIIKNEYDEATYKAFYEGKIEPILKLASQAFTNACFTPLEYARGNRLIFSENMLNHASTQTKVNVIQATRELGLFTTNEQRAMFGYAPVKGGDERQVSLNYIKESDQSKYQTGQAKEVNDNGESADDGTKV